MNKWDVYLSTISISFNSALLQKNIMKNLFDINYSNIIHYTDYSFDLIY